MSKQAIFTGAGVAIVTPMKADGSVDLELYRELVEDQIQNGTDAIITCGTTGESSTLDDEEHIAVMRAAVEQANGRVPVIAGTGSNDTAYGIHLSQEAKEMGADALLLVTPYYNKTSQAGLIAHYEKTVNEVKMPTILYNVPSRTGVNINVDTVVELAKNPYIVGLKQANANLASVAEIASRCDIDIYSGNDNEIVAMLALGAKGVISVLSNVIPRETHEICAKWFEGKPDESRDLQLKYLELANTLFCDVNPIPVKEAMNMMGWNVGDVRLPLVGLNDANKAKLRAVLDKYGLLKA
ncbi:MAG: 4-hydroxy-tetrahydrodipicolinate synthase [Clostridia bacterium]|nr:4-hydroxy-tetrahydrodipicolinate synthase [Clostridia bacterium]